VSQLGAAEQLRNLILFLDLVFVLLLLVHDPLLILIQGIDMLVVAADLPASGQ